MTPEEPTPTALAERYFATWTAHDFDAFEALLAPDVSFRGPFGEADGPADCRAGIEGMSKLMRGLDVKARGATGADVITWFELQTDHGAIPVANWMRTEDGRIRQIRVTFDPRPLLGD